DDDRLADVLRHLVDNDATGRIGGATRREWADDPDGPGRPFLGEGRGGGDENGAGAGDKAHTHGWTSQGRQLCRNAANLPTGVCPLGYRFAAQTDAPDRHCEERSDEAIQGERTVLDCFVAPLGAPRNDETLQNDARIADALIAFQKIHLLGLDLPGAA